MPLTRVDWPFANVAEKESFHVTACCKEYVSLRGESLDCNVLSSEDCLHQDMLLHTRSSTFLPVVGGCAMIPRWNYGQYVARLCALAFFWRAESRRANEPTGRHSGREVCVCATCERGMKGAQTYFSPNGWSKHWTLAWWDRQLPVFLSGVGYNQGDWVLVLLL